MTITRVGSTSKYANGWEVAFGKGRKAKSSASAVAPVKSAGKTVAGKKAAPKSADVAASKKGAAKAGAKKKSAKKSAKSK